jgi:predicted nucleic acid-binding protein
VTVFVDTAVVMYANGADHPLRHACREIMVRIRDGQLEAVTSSEVVQEILHRFISIKRPEFGIEIARVTLDAFAPVVPISHALMRRVPDLVGRYPRLSSRDLVHVATCIHEGIPTIVSPDRAFDQVAEVRRIDPLAFADPLFQPA